MKSRLLAVVLLVGATSSLHAGADWPVLYQLEKGTGNLAFLAPWGRAEVSFRVTSGDNRRTLAATLSPRDVKLTLDGQELPQSWRSTEALDRFRGRELPLLVKFRTGEWAIFADRQLVARVPAPFAPPLALRQATGTGLPDAKVRFQKVEPFLFNADFQIAPDEKNQLGPWTPESGQWRIHTVQEDAVAQKSSPNLAARPLQAERSANFFCLNGKGEKGRIVTGEPFADEYELQASVQTMPGETGLLFDYENEGNCYRLILRVAADETRPAVLRLERRSSRQTPHTTLLGAVQFAVTHGQWLMLRARAASSRIQCFVDHTQVLDVAEVLPAGGRFGLWVDSKEEIRFDDVTMRSVRDLDLDQVDKIRFWTVADQGMLPPLPPRKAFWGRDAAPPAPPSSCLEPAPAAQERSLVVGVTAHDPHFFSARFEPAAKTGSYGLLVNCRGDQQPVLRFVRESTEEQDRYRLERVTAGTAKLLVENRLLHRPDPLPPRSFTLAADATEHGELRLYCDDVLVLFQQLPNSELSGASGVWLDPRTSARISQLRYHFERPELLRNRNEENKIYETDPFMRNWSSQEGEWFTDEASKLTWYKSDFFGRFGVHLPKVDGAKLYVGIEEGQTAGAMIVTVQGPEVQLFAGDQPGGPALQHARLPDSALAITDQPVIVVSAEGYWLWASSQGSRLFAQRLRRPLAGRRMRVEGLTLEQLKLTRVDRYNTRDFLFTEASYDWVANGGAWQVINRFQCDPRWSHMNGENDFGIAALWNKWTYGGDFCFELYAGIRHGKWYNRCGDINLTIMNQHDTPSDGYTITTTGWDPDYSQLWTRFYRQGEQVDQSDRYLVPRVREGNRRRLFEAVIVPGQRDVHGAWYYLKLRRVGKKLQYWFDNELVMEREDAQPLAEGSMGIWTFLNSMMVARVKVGAERITPRLLAFTPLAQLPPESPPTVAAPDLERFAVVLNGGQPVQALRPAAWRADDEAGHGYLTWHDEGGEQPYFVFHTLLGNGSMAAKAELPATPYPLLAGFRFEVKRTARARINFHYAIGTGTAADFQPAVHYFHALSGNTYARGECRLYGQTEVPGLPADERWYEQGEWKPVEVWLPTAQWEGSFQSLQQTVKVEGFGCLTPSFDLEGLTGNGPGEGYAVRNFAPVYYQPPKLELQPGTHRLSSFLLLDGRRELVREGSHRLSVVNDWLGKRPRSGLQALTLRTVDRSGRAVDAPLAWVGLPPQPTLSCRWATDVPDALVVSADCRYPERRLVTATFTLGGATLTHSEQAPDQRLVLLPRRAELAAAKPGPLFYVLAAGVPPQPLEIPPRRLADSDPPILVGLAGAAPLCRNFEDRLVGDGLAAAPASLRLHFSDPVQGSYLEVYNTGPEQRLTTRLAVGFSLAQYPLLQFLYRAEPMTRVTLVLPQALGQQNYVHLSEPQQPAVTVRGAPENLVVDERNWHPWTGIISDAVVATAALPRCYWPGAITFASVNGADQTGRNTHWDLDDLVLGPAVSKPAQLACIPEYYAAAGVREVFSAVLPGALPWVALDATRQQSLKWTRQVPGKQIVPDLNGLPQGVHHLLLKATSKSGRESPITDVPFLYDTEPPLPSFAPETWQDLLSNGPVVRAKFAMGGGGPLDLEALRVVAGGTPTTQLPASLHPYSHTPAEDQLVLNWPVLLRQELAKLGNGQSTTITITGIADGAGNRGPDLKIPIRTDYAADKTGPTLLPTSYPANLVLKTDWEGQGATDLQRPEKLVLVPAQNNATTIQAGLQQEPFLSSQSYGAHGQLTLAGAWNVKATPWLSFRLRRPEVETPDKTTVHLALTLSDNRVFAVALGPARPKTSLQSLPQPFEWRANQWENVTLNLDQVLTAAGLDAGARAGAQIVSLAIVRNQTVNGAALHLQSLYLYGPWQDSHVVTVEAFDASGVPGLAWEYTDVKGTVLQRGNLDTCTVIPTKLGLNRVPGGWLVLRARDKAGNLSLPVRLPVPKPE